MADTFASAIYFDINPANMIRVVRPIIRQPDPPKTVNGGTTVPSPNPDPPKPEPSKPEPPKKGKKWWEDRGKQ